MRYPEYENLSRQKCLSRVRVREEQGMKTDDFILKLDSDIDTAVFMKTINCAL